MAVFTPAATRTSGKGSVGLAATVTRRLRASWGWARAAVTVSRHSSPQVSVTGWNIQA
jgi:hypothetical protein